MVSILPKCLFFFECEKAQTRVNGIKIEKIWTEISKKREMGLGEEKRKEKGSRG
jgi:hypothetical protein